MTFVSTLQTDAAQTDAAQTDAPQTNAPLNVSQAHYLHYDENKNLTCPIWKFILLQIKGVVYLK